MEGAPWPQWFSMAESTHTRRRVRCLLLQRLPAQSCPGCPSGPPPFVPLCPVVPHSQCGPAKRENSLCMLGAHHPLPQWASQGPRDEVGWGQGLLGTHCGHGGQGGGLQEGGARAMPWPERCTPVAAESPLSCLRGGLHFLEIRERQGESGSPEFRHWAWNRRKQTVTSGGPDAGPLRPENRLRSVGAKPREPQPARGRPGPS